MKVRRNDLKFTDKKKRTMGRFIIFGQYILKGTDFSELADEMLAEIEWKLNHRPVSHWVTGRRWHNVSNYETMTFEECGTSN